MMQLGDVPTGGYCWRPAYINHGAFASECGCIALGRTDSKLFNHFHYIPWSTPVQNAEMKLAMIVKHTRPTVNLTGTGTIIMVIVSITTIITVMTNG